MAGLARRERCPRRSDRQRYFGNQKKSQQQTFNRERVESGGDRADGVAAVPRALSILCFRRGGFVRWRTETRTELPTLSTQLRFISWRAVQHCVLRTPHHDDGASCRSYAGRFCPHVRRSPSLQEPSRPGPRTADARLSTFAADEFESERQKYSGFQVRRLPTCRLRPASFN